MRRIKKNAARCKLCGDTVESTHRHDFRTCSCGNLSVDGGHDYLRRGWMDDKDSFEDLNEFVPDLMPTYGCGPGWWAMLDKELKEFYEIDPQLSDLRVKEKYGKARVDYFTETETRYDLLAMQEEILDRASGQTCELCGRYGTLRSERGWVQCRCERCHNADRNERSKIMRETAQAYEVAIREAEALLPPDFDPTEREAAAIRYGIQYRGEFDIIMNRILKSHRAT